jgi:isochorismate hydrolase
VQPGCTTDEAGYVADKKPRHVRLMKQVFNVILVTDAMTDTPAEAHEHSLKHVFPRLGETASSQDILLLLEKRC